MTDMVLAVAIMIVIIAVVVVAGVILYVLLVKELRKKVYEDETLSVSSRKLP